MRESDLNVRVVFSHQSLRELEVEVKGLVIYETASGRNMFRVNDEICPLVASDKGIEHFLDALH